MREFKNNRRAPVLLRFGGLCLGVMALFLVSAVAVRAAWGMYGKFSSAQAASATAQLELAALRERKAGVQAVLEDLSSARGIEAEVRQRFGVALPGEGEIRIVRDDREEEAPERTDEGGFIGRMLRSILEW